MPEEKLSLGQAIDKVSEALSALEPDARIVALNAVCNHLGIPIGGATIQQAPDPQIGKSPPKEPATEVQESSDPVVPKRATKDIRSLKEEKQPKSAQQMACVVAYYLAELAGEGERSDSVKTSDLEKYFKQASFRLPGEISQVLKNAKKAGYFESAERGQYKLNAVGYNLVTHGLPAGGE